ncbi:hypothetical protein CFP71_14855 [Amycolatopsis thailandensis]|uniref:Uncharacterized protein n=1 Tax=Amycolatopsis thailandensis TaxID=589330 RepID=A0A229SB18_9PSEU|nr:hypothetical protein [Amycolatopsis thailandensis]OXM56106.1 hypothetical protein CFP71_14855 [Amycolatopsis thailandensis]
MQNWMKYALQATLVSGGLLMLGTGIASAAENVDPDVPASVLDQHVLAPAVSGLADAVKQAQPLRQLDTASQNTVRPIADTVDGTPAIVTPVGPVHAVPLELFQVAPPQLGDLADDVREPDLNAPLGAELGADEIPLLPVLSRAETVGDVLPVTSAPSVPLTGTVTTDPFDPGAGTRVTALHADAPEVATTYDAPVLNPPVVSAGSGTRRDDAPASTLPLLGGVPLGDGGSLLPTTLPTNGGVPVLGDLTHLIPSLPVLGRGGMPIGSVAPSLTTKGSSGVMSTQKLANSGTALTRQ